jgi:hypothetical protein
MAIDGIGKPPISGLPSLGGSSSVAGVKPQADFSIDSASGPGTAQPASAVDATNLTKQIESGQLTQERYLEARVDLAVQHLVGQIPADQIDVIQATLRDQLSTDPMLLDMVARATAGGHRRKE